MRTIFLSLAISVHAAAASYTGAISEAGCGLKHANGGAEKCVSGCVKKGAAPVFVTDGKIVKLSNAEKVMDFLGKKVKVSGKLDGDTLTVDSIQTAE